MKILSAHGWEVYTYGRLRSGPGHRLPSLTRADVVDDSPPFPLHHRWYQASWFGMTFNVCVPAEVYYKMLDVSLRIHNNALVDSVKRIFM